MNNTLTEIQKSFITSDTKSKPRFRFWDTKDSLMLSWNLVSQTALNRDAVHMMYTIITNPGRYIPLEGTEVFSKNWDEAYEGDVIKHSPHWSGKFEYSLVIRKSSGFFFPFGDGDYSVIWVDGDFDIIGNVFENPELEKIFQNETVRIENEMY